MHPMRVFLQETERDAEGHKGGNMQVETGVIPLQARETPRPPQTPEARRGAQDIFSSEALEETNPVDTLLSDFWPPVCEITFLLF